MSAVLTADDRRLLVFDGDCGFCTSSVEFGRRRIGRMPTSVPYQRADLAALGLTEEACRTAVQYRDASGAVHAAHLAVAALLVDAGGMWRPCGVVLRLPVVRTVAGAAYRWIAANRHRLGRGEATCGLDPGPAVSERPVVGVPPATTVPRGPAATPGTDRPGTPPDR